MQVSDTLLMSAFTFTGCFVLTAGIFSFLSYVIGWVIAKDLFYTVEKETIKTVMIVVLVILISIVLSVLTVFNG